MSEVPPPPLGFSLDTPAARPRTRKSDLPPPPPGFALDVHAAEPLKPAGEITDPGAPKLSSPEYAAYARSKGRALDVRGTVPLPDLRNAQAIDGDTLRTADATVRLWGVDAPELKQPGYDRQGQPVPIGQQARDALADLASAESIIGNPVGSSYGRLVAPVTTGGRDLAETLARAGNALAAPAYLKENPQRRHDYMAAERLARINRLGVHDTYHQAPADFRKAPIAVPDKEAVAVFWDTPTPLAGMRADDEKTFIGMAYDPAVPVEQVVQFAFDHGWTADPDQIQDAREKVAKGAAGGLDYKKQIKPLTNSGDGATGAAVRGAASGFLAGGLDEVGAVADLAGLTSGRENVWNSDRRLADIWANNQEQNASILGYDEFAHPTASTVGEVAGAITSGFVIPNGQGARTVPQLARVGGVYGGAEGFLGTDGSVGERAIGGAIGVPIGAAVNAAGGKALEVLTPGVAKAVALMRGNRAQAASAGSAGHGSGPPPPSGGKKGAEATPHPAGQNDSGQVAMAAEGADNIRQDMQRQLDVIDVRLPQQAIRMDQPLTEAQMRAAAERVEPGDVLPISSNQVGSMEEAAAIGAGRVSTATASNERDMLTRRTIKAWGGAEVPKVGPVDMVGWLRTRGGLKDQGTEVSHMGLDNRARSMDFVGQEARFGPLVNNDSGMDLDDAAMAAWEQGYFPELTERPDVNTFLDALRDTYEGRQRRFLPEDQPEVERFYGAQQERYDLEQQRFETGAPVYADRSVPADEPPPLPPVQAYEEWPSGGPDFAGNINLGKLESPQDIKRALATTEARVGFDAATRGRVTQAETEALAAELNMTPETLLSRRKGQAFNAEEALAARQILAKSGNELVNAARKVQRLERPGDDDLAAFRQAWVRHAAIQEQVAGATAEAGRALQQFRMMADSRAVPRDVLSAIVSHGGGPDRLQDAANVLLEAVGSGPGVFNTVVKKAMNPRFRDKLVEVYINALLSGPQTHAVNMLSNTLTSLAQLPEHAAAGVLGGVRRLAGRGDDAVTGSEVGARAFGLLQGAKEGMRLFASAVRTGEPSDMVSKVEGQQFKAVSGLKGEVVRIPTRLLNAEDELFKGIARRMELNGLAVRQARKEGLRGDDAKARIAELSEVPTDDMLEQSMEYARYLTFQRKLGPGAQKVSGLTQDWTPLKFFLPFVRTPTNLLKFAVERSPAAPLLKEWRADFLAGGAKRDLAVARVMLGTGVGMAIYEAALAGKITGSAPSDPAKSKLMYADGWQPYSVRLGDKWYSYKRLDPFSTTFGVAADMALLPSGMSDRQKDDQATLLVASIMGNLANKTWLSGLSDIVGALGEPDRKAERLVQRLAGSLTIPTGIAQIARTLDPVARETDSIGEYIQSRIPGLSDNLLPRRNVWGAPVTNEGGVGPDIVSPIWQSTAKDDPVNQELLKAGVSVGLPQKKVGSRQLTPEEYNRYQEAAGSRAYPALSRLVKSPIWGTLDDEAKQDAVTKAMKIARTDARAELFGGAPAKGSGKSARGTRGDSKKDVPPPPPGFVFEGESAGRNVYADLQKLLPGADLTSGFRTREYQADMRRRGYKPAENSGHLDGSSFDIVPPPGKSIAWVAAQVKRYDPNAWLNPEGDHLHVTFPGYYGAPPLGGAKKAGLHNPLMGMPPPPPGFKLDAR